MASSCVPQVADKTVISPVFFARCAEHYAALGKRLCGSLHKSPSAPFQSKSGAEGFPSAPLCVGYLPRPQVAKR